MSKEIVDLKIDAIIKTLETAIQVCYKAPDNPDQGYPYAAGYAKAAMQDSLTYVQHLKEYLDNGN